MAMLYESLLVFAVAFFATLAFLAVTGGMRSELERHALQFYLFLVLGAYFVVCWCRGGATLAMHTWRLRVVRKDGSRIGFAQAWLRYALAWVSLLGFGVGFLWALFDRDGLFLHDRLSGTRLMLRQA
jgi:uncharacterized RDD family membrane protein YckC